MAINKNKVTSFPVKSIGLKPHTLTGVTTSAEAQDLMMDRGRVFTLSSLSFGPVDADGNREVTVGIRPGNGMVDMVQIPEE